MALELERSAIVSALRESGGDIGKAARALGASRRTLQNRMREYGMARGKAGRRKRLLPYRRKHRVAVGVVGALAAAGALVIGARFLKGGGA